MAGRGFPPAEGSKRAQGESVKMVADGKLRGFALPRGWVVNPRTGQVEDWHPATVRWWNHWRKSPQATRMLTQVDWDYLLDTALMHHKMWTTQNFDTASEVRLRVANFGATPADRQRLRADVVMDRPEPRETETPANEVQVGTVTDMADRRRRIS